MISDTLINVRFLHFNDRPLTIQVFGARSSTVV